MVQPQPVRQQRHRPLNRKYMLTICCPILYLAENTYAILEFAVSVLSNLLNVREMKLSAAEKQRQYRARRNADPERRAAYLQKNRETWHENKKLGKVKTMKDLSEREKRRKRAYWRRAQRQSRERKQVIEHQVTPLQSPDVDPQSQMSR
ncbi:hypothetical protein ABVT39_006238 [Epinephelus coioides]